MAARDDWPGNLFADKRAFESNFMRFLSFALVFFFLAAGSIVRSPVAGAICRKLLLGGVISMGSLVCYRETGLAFSFSIIDYYLSGFKSSLVDFF